MPDFSVVEWIRHDPWEFVAIAIAIVFLAFLVGVFAATVQWVWELWVLRKKD